MTSSASIDTFPADVAEVRRAAGITIAPEAALHRALQERTDELERVRESARAESLMLRRRVSEMEDENEDNRRRRAQAVETMECREAEREVIEAGLRQQIYTLTRERDEARASLAEAQVDPLMRTLQQVRRERDEARAEIAAALREIPIEQHRFQAGKPPVVLRDEVAHVVREWARRNHEFDRVWDACETVLTSDEARAVEWTDEQGVEVLVLAALAKLRCEHGQGGCMFKRRWKASVPMLDDDSDSGSTISITATDPDDAARRVREYVSAHAPPTAPDVGSTTSAPAAGAADPPRPPPEPSARALAWARTVFGEEP